MPYVASPNDIPDSYERSDYCGECSAHFQVLEAAFDEANVMTVKCEALAAAPVTELGKTHQEKFFPPKPESSQQDRLFVEKRIQMFFIAVGLTTEAELLAAKAAGKPLTLDETLSVGQQFLGKLTTNAKNTKYVQFGYDMWPMDSEKGKGIPVNAGMLDKNGTKPPAKEEDPGDSFAGTF